MPTIRRVEPVILRYPEPNDHGNQRMTVLVRLETACGIVGWGEAIAMWPEACAGVAAVLNGGLASVAVGREVTDTEGLWAALKAQSWWYGEGGLATMAIAGLDLAAWDARGQFEGRPVYELLGGRVHDRLPAIASLHVNKPTTEAVAREVAGYITGGFRGAKLGLGKRGALADGKSPETNTRLAGQVREAIGAEPLLMIDVGNGIRWDVPTVLRVMRRMEDEADIHWLEEPVHPADLDGLRTLKAAARTRIATGEREWTVAAYRALIAQGCVDVFGHDPARAEGLTGFMKVARAVEAAGARINAHAWSTAITTAASLHGSVATEAAYVFEFKPIESPMQHELPETPLWPVDGYAAPPDRPGLGVTLREAVIDRYRVG